MKKIVFVVLIITMVQALANAQSCLPDGIVFKTQEEIDNFQTNYPGCTEIEGNVQIQGDEITSLSGLSVLTIIQGRLKFYTCEVLDDLTGLDNLTYVGGDLIVYVWPGVTTTLTSLTGLENLTTIGGDLEITGTDKLVDFAGLNNLSSIGEDLFVAGNELLQNFSGMDTLTSVGEEIWIGENIALTSLTGLEDLTTVGGPIEIYDNDALTSLTGLDSIDAESIDGYWYISYNDVLSICAIQSLCDYLALPESSVDVYDNASGCDDVEEIEAACTVSVNDDLLKSQFIIYPIPANERLFFDSNQIDPVNEVIVYNQVGQIILHQEHASNPLDVSMLTQGVYVIEFITNNQIMKEKLVIE